MKGSNKQGSNEAYQGKHAAQSHGSESSGYTPIQQGEVVVDGTVLQKKKDKKPFIIAAVSVVGCFARGVWGWLPVLLEPFLS